MINKIHLKNEKKERSSWRALKNKKKQIPYGIFLLKLIAIETFIWGTATENDFVKIYTKFMAFGKRIKKREIETCGIVASILVRISTLFQCVLRHILLIWKYLIKWIILWKVRSNKNVFFELKVYHWKASIKY